MRPDPRGGARTSTRAGCWSGPATSSPTGVDTLVVTTGIGFRGWLDTAETAGLGRGPAAPRWTTYAWSRAGPRPAVRSRPPGCAPTGSRSPRPRRRSRTSCSPRASTASGSPSSTTVPATTAWTAGSPRAAPSVIAARGLPVGPAARPGRGRGRGPPARGRLLRRGGVHLRARPRRLARRARPARRRRPTCPRARRRGPAAGRRGRPGDRRAAGERRDAPVVPDRSRMGALVRRVIMDARRRAARRADRGRACCTCAPRPPPSTTTCCRSRRSGLAVLRRLARTPGQVVTPRRAARGAARRTAADPHTAEVAVARLREALRLAAALVRTVIKRGYVLAAGRAHGVRPARPRRRLPRHRRPRRDRRRDRPGRRGRRRCVGVPVSEAYVDVHGPYVADVVAGHGGAAVVVPLLLAAGYHVHVDVAEAVAPWDACRGGRRPRPRRPADRGARSTGSARPAPRPATWSCSPRPAPPTTGPRRSVRAAADDLAAAWGAPVGVAYGASRSPRVPCAVTRSPDRAARTPGGARLLPARDRVTSSAGGCSARAPTWSPTRCSVRAAPRPPAGGPGGGALPDAVRGVESASEVVLGTR